MPRQAYPRPFSVTILALGVLTFAALYLTRVFVTLQEWDFLRAHALPGAAWYLLGTGVLWSALFFPWGVGLWRGAARACRSALPLGTVYLAAQWSERLYLHWRNAPAYNHPFWAGASLLAWGGLWWVCSRRKTKLFFGELHEQKSQN